MDKVYKVRTFVGGNTLQDDGDFVLGQGALPIAIDVSAIDPNADTLLGTLCSSGAGTVSIRLDWNTTTVQYDAQITWGSSELPTVQAGNTIVSITPWHAAGQYAFGGRLASLQLSSSDAGLSLGGSMVRLGQHLMSIVLNFQVASGANSWTYEDFLNPLTTRNYRVVKAGDPGLADWKATAASPDTPVAVSLWACDAAQVSLMNQSARQAAATAAPAMTLGDALVVEFQNVITTSQWMTQTWHLISQVPAQEFIFMGCHDALASYGGTGYGGYNIVLPQLFTQTQRLDAMLTDGCRFLDLRFTKIGFSSVADMHGVHPFNVTSIGSAKIGHDGIFNVTVADAVSALARFFSASGNKEIVFINLKLVEYPNSTTLVNDYIEFANLLTAAGVRLVNPQEVNPSDNLAAFKASGDVILMVSDDHMLQPLPANQYWPQNLKLDAAKGGGQVMGPGQWFNAVLDSGEYLGLNTMLGDQQFCYLAMQQNDAYPFGTPNSLKGKMNGALSDWILNASPPVSGEPNIAGNNSLIGARAALASVGLESEQLMLPYKPFFKALNQTFFRRNHNLVAVDFYEKGLFVINAVVQNLRVAQRISEGNQAIPFTRLHSFTANPQKQYSIMNFRSRLVWDVQGNSTSAGAYIIQYSHNADLNQKFYIESQGNLLFKIRSASSGRYLSIKPQYDKDSNLIAGGSPTYETWFIESNNGADWTITNSATGMLLTIYRNGNSNGDSVVQYPPGASDPSHRWFIF